MTDLADGETIEMRGSAAKPYVIKNVGGVYSCSCPAWRNQSIGIETRTCKHIRKLRGDKAEQERVGNALPRRTAPKDKEEGPPLLLAQSWDNSTDLRDWWMSEKLDGVRAYWDGKQFLSRQGNLYHAPDWFVKGLPSEPLDGELWMDRKAFQKTISIVRRQDKSEHWKELRFLVFDAPGVKETFETRLEFLKDLMKSKAPDHARMHEHRRCKSMEDLQDELARIESMGGEGLMLRQPESSYEVGRSFTLLKVKTFHDAEAIVLDHQAGRGKHKGKLGSLAVRLADGTEFSVGTGFSDGQRLSPPAIGSTITFRYQELSDGGVPRFPSFLRLQKPAPQTTSSPESAKENSMENSDQPAPPASGARHFEFTGGTSNKFWEISSSGSEVTVRFGRIGASGQTKTKSFPSAESASAYTDKLVAEKTGKGYVETQPPAS